MTKKEQQVEMEGINDTPLGKAADAFLKAKESFKSGQKELKEKLDAAEEAFIEALIKENRLEIRFSGKRFVVDSTPSRRRIKITK